MNTSLISISNFGSDTQGQISFSNETINENANVTFTFSDTNGEVTSIFELSEAQINIFDSEYYLVQNPDVAASLTTEYADTRTSTFTTNANLPKLGVSSIVHNGENPAIIDNEIIANSNLLQHSAALEDYVTSGAAEGQDPSPLFDSEYYLEQNPDVASALAGGSFNGDPLLHYVEAGATEGRDPNPYFDSDYYVTQNPSVVETGLNPLEHYVLIGSSQGADPSGNFDPEFYLAQNQDVAAAGIDPLTHFLTFGQDEGRLPIAG